MIVEVNKARKYRALTHKVEWVSEWWRWGQSCRCHTLYFHEVDIWPCIVAGWNLKSGSICAREKCHFNLLRLKPIIIPSPSLFKKDAMGIIIGVNTVVSTSSIKAHATRHFLSYQTIVLITNQSARTVIVIITVTYAAFPLKLLDCFCILLAWWLDWEV